MSGKGREWQGVKNKARESIIPLFFAIIKYMLRTVDFSPYLWNA